VPAGSVGIAGNQIGIYPLESPGGWNIIGRTPVVLFDGHANDSVLFQPGDEVKFFPITKEEFDVFNHPTFDPLA
jgi:inhibitor of KinA